MERRRAAWCQCAFVLASFAGCAQIDPQVGPSQESCGESVASALAAAGNSAYGGGTATNAYGASAATSPAHACTPDAGGPCDVCESTYCCMTRLACYSDPVCVCADHALDTCFDALGAAPSAKQATACLDAFSAHGAVEQARIACQQAWCAAACAVP
jgi:hypothetical protein